MYRHFVGDTKGWIEVRKDELEKVGLLDSISSSSYTKDNFVYLDEDIDFSLFLCYLDFEPKLILVPVNDTYFDKYEQFKESLQ